MTEIFAGIDIGGTYVRIVLYNSATRKCSAVKKNAFIRLADPELEVEQNICRLIASAFTEDYLELKDLAGIGLSLAAIFDRDKGDIILWPNNKTWNKFPIKAYLSERYQVPVVMEDDANAAALGEQMAGAGKGNSHFAYMTISTGIGCGLVLNDTLYTGPNGWAGEIGHIRAFAGGDEECNCGTRGCFQAVASGPALLSKYVTATGQTNRTNNESLTLQNVVELAHKGDEPAISLFAEAGKQIASMITTLVMLLDLPLIILGGGVAESGAVLWHPIVTELDGNLRSLNRKVSVVKSNLGDRNGALGALNLLHQTVKNRLLSI